MPFAGCMPFAAPGTVAPDVDAPGCEFVEPNGTIEVPMVPPTAGTPLVPGTPGVVGVVDAPGVVVDGSVRLGNPGTGAPGVGTPGGCVPIVGAPGRCAPAGVCVLIIGVPLVAGVGVPVPGGVPIEPGCPVCASAALAIKATRPVPARNGFKSIIIIVSSSAVDAPIRNG
jgi:hypothetical protein